MDSEIAASSSTPPPVAEILLAQSRAIDTILARLVVLDPGYNPVRRLDWNKIQIGRAMADQIEREQVNHDGVAEAVCGSDGDAAVGDPSA